MIRKIYSKNQNQLSHLKLKLKVVIKGGKAKERIVTNEEAQQKLTPRDYVATITEVLDSNRIRVDLSYNDGLIFTNIKVMMK